MIEREWEGEERRKVVRRRNDRDICPFHDLACGAIEENKSNIRDMEKIMATKEDLDNLWNDVKTRSPRWVLVLLVGLMAGILAWMVTGMESKFDQLYVLKANQEILLKAFHIEPIKTVPEAEKELRTK